MALYQAPTPHTPTTPLLRTATTANPEQPPLSQHLSASTRRAAVQLSTALIGGVDLVGKWESCLSSTPAFRTLHDNLCGREEQFCPHLPHHKVNEGSLQMYAERMEEEKIEEMFDEIFTECCTCVCVCVCVCARSPPGTCP